MDKDERALPPDREPARLVDAAWVASRLGVGLRFVRRLVAERRIAYHKLGKLLRFDPADVERFVEKSRRPTSG